MYKCVNKKKNSEYINTKINTVCVFNTAYHSTDLLTCPVSLQFLQCHTGSQGVFRYILRFHSHSNKNKQRINKKQKIKFVAEERYVPVFLSLFFASFGSLSSNVAFPERLPNFSSCKISSFC